MIILIFQLILYFSILVALKICLFLLQVILHLSFEISSGKNHVSHIFLYFLHILLSFVCIYKIAFDIIREKNSFFMVFCEGVVLLAISRMSPTTCVSATFQLSTLVFSHLFIYLSFGPPHPLKNIPSLRSPPCDLLQIVLCFNLFLSYISNVETCRGQQIKKIQLFLCSKYFKCIPQKSFIFDGIFPL